MRKWWLPDKYQEDSPDTREEMKDVFNYVQVVAVEDVVPVLRGALDDLCSFGRVNEGRYALSNFIKELEKEGE